MIPVPYFRSSSYNNWDFCEQQYFLNYVLGIPRGACKKALKGTITHKVLELLAKVKQQFDLGHEVAEFDDEIGKVIVRKDEFLIPETLSVIQIDKINRSRINASTYKHDCKIPYGTVREGVKIVEDFIRRAYDTYENQANDWAPVDFKDITNWSWMTLEYRGGIFDPRKMKIVQPEGAFDFAIERDWAKQPNGDYLRIKGTIDLITEITPDYYEIVDWKGLPIETPIPTPEGWTTMGELKIGDIVFDKDGKQTKVIAKSQQTSKPCYLIEFDDKSTVECDNEHLWSLYDDTVVPITELKINDKIPVTKPLDLPDQVLPIDPYVLGYWLGNGRNRNSEITSADDFVFNEIQDRGYIVGNDISGKDTNCYTRTIFGLKKELRALNLLHNKHIPDIYLRASYKQRLDLLRGLMDSDGNANPTRKQAVFTNCNEVLSNDFKELALSLGQRPNLCCTDQFGFGLHVKAYPVHFRPIGINPFLLPRKADRIDPEWGPGLSHIRYVDKITEIPAKVTQCISVDSQTKTYLCTYNMIPTHNTGQRLDWANDQKKDFKKLCIDFQLMLYNYAARRLYPNVKHFSVSIFFIRDGGPYTLCFDDESIEAVERKLYERWTEITQCKLPEMVDPDQKDFRCTKICDYYKAASPDGKSNFCRFIHEQVKKHGVTHVIEKHTHKGHNVANYAAPGELKD